MGHRKSGVRGFEPSLHDLGCEIAPKRRRMVVGWREQHLRCIIMG